MNKDCLFIGGPWAGRVIGVISGLDSVRAIDGNREVEYLRGQIADSIGHRHDVFVLDGLDAVCQLLAHYAKQGEA